MKNVKDHLGNVYHSKKDMLFFYKITEVTFRRRINAGMTLEEALTTPVQPKGMQSRKQIEDHTGRVFDSIESMCDSWNITRAVYESRKKKGKTLEEILTTPVAEAHKAIKCKDHLGNEFDSIKDMLRYYGINESTFNNRLIRGWSLERALTERSGLPGENTQKKCVDHLGNEYNSIYEMCRKYGANRFNFEWRMKHGWTLKDALTKHNDNRKDSCQDHLGNIFASKIDMCRTYNISVAAFRGRIKNGWTLEEALTIPRHMYIGEYRVAECLKRIGVKFYHDCTVKNIFTDFGIDVNWNEFLSELQEKFKKNGMNWTKNKIQRLRPDFVLYEDSENNICGVIEFDGEQHQNYLDFFFKTLEDFLMRVDSDFVKQSLWEHLNIPMLRIRHDQLDTIDDMVEHFVKNPEYYIKNHNTYLSNEEYWNILNINKEALCA